MFHDAIVPAIAKTVVWWGELDKNVDFLIANLPRALKEYKSLVARGRNFKQRFDLLQDVGREVFANSPDLLTFFNDTVAAITEVKDKRDMIAHGTYSSKIVGDGQSVKVWVVIASDKLTMELTHEELNEVPEQIAAILARMSFLMENQYPSIERAFGFSDEQTTHIREVLRPVRGPRIDAIHDDPPVIGEAQNA